MDYLMIFDVISIVAGIFCIVSPNKAYNFGRKGEAEIPKNWHIKSRVFGVIFILVGAVFLYLSLR